MEKSIFHSHNHNHWLFKHITTIPMRRKKKRHLKFVGKNLYRYICMWVCVCIHSKVVFCIMKVTKKGTNSIA